MLIKLTVPFILAATVFSASVPVLDRRGEIVTNIACPTQPQGQGRGNGLPDNTNGVLAVRDFLGSIVGYLAPPQGDQQGFTFTEDRGNALLATIIGTGDGKPEGSSGNGKHLSVRIGLAGGNSFLGGTVISLPNSSDGPSSSGGSPPSSGGPPSGGAPSGGPSSGGSPSSGGPSSGGSPPSGPPSGGPSSPPSGGSSSGGPSSGGSANAGGAEDVTCSTCVPLGGLAGLPDIVPSGGKHPKGDKPLKGGKPSIGGLPSSNSVTSVALGLVSAEDLSSEEKSLKLKDAVGDAFNLSFLYDTESRQILGQKQVGNSAPQPTNFQYDQGQFCLFDQRRASVQSAQSAAGFVNVFFVPT